MKRVVVWLAAAWFGVAPLLVVAADATGPGFPSRPMRIVVPATPSGGTDILARTLAQRFAEVWGVAVIADNRPGASGIIGSDIVAKAPADGHTLLLAFTTHVTNPSLQLKLPYDTLNDFAPVSRVAAIPSMLVVHPSLAARTVKEVIALAQSKPGQIAYATAGSGSATHLSAVLLESMTGVRLVHIPYKGAAPALQDLLGGQVAMMFGNMASTMPHVQAGRLRAIAVGTPKRSPSLPDVPSVAESGYPGFDASLWLGFFAPKGTPAAILKRLETELVSVARAPEMKEPFERNGAEALTMTPAEMRKLLPVEIDKYAKIIKAAGIKLE